MSAEKRERIQDLARESTLIDAINLAQDICAAASNGGGTGPGTTDGTGPGTTDGTGPGTTDGTGPGTTDGTGPGTTDGTGPEPPLPCTEFDAGCEFYHEPLEGRLTTFDGECHDCVQSMAIPEQMNYSVVGSGFKLGYVYRTKVLKGIIDVNIPVMPDGKTIDPNYNENIDSDSNGKFIKITPESGFDTSNVGPFAEQPGEYLFDPIADDNQNIESVTVTDFKVFIRGFDFAKPNYGITGLNFNIDMCPGNDVDPDAPSQPDCLPNFDPNTYQLCTELNIFRQAYIWHPGLTGYEDKQEDSNNQCLTRVFDKNQWLPLMPIGYDEYQRWFGFDSQTVSFFAGSYPDDTYGAGITNRLMKECIDPKTGTAIIRVITTQLFQGNCPVFDVYYNFIGGCGLGDCELTTPDGLNFGQVPIERQTYDCSDTALVINNANDTHVKLNSLEMNGPLIGNNWFTNFLIEENKNKPFISGSYLNSDYIDTYPGFSAYESERFSDFLYPTLNGNNNNWSLSDSGPIPANSGFITIEELGIGDITRIDSFTIHGNYGPDAPSDRFYQTNYIFNTNNLPGEGTIAFDLQYIPPQTPPFSCYNPFGYVHKTSTGTRTIIYPNLNNQPYSTSVSLNIKPGDTLTLFVRRYIALIGLCREFDSPKVKVKNLIFENSQKRYGQVVSCIVDLDYCNTNQGYDPSWPSTDIGTNLPIENGINGLKIIETMRTETNDPDLIIERGLWLYNHTEQVWVGNPYGKISEDINLSPGIDLNTLHPYWAMRSKCTSWSEDNVTCQQGINPIQCGSTIRSKITGEYFYGQYDCTMPQDTTETKQDSHKYGCADFDCCCQICNSQYGFPECCDNNLDTVGFCGWDTFCANVARRFCGNDFYCGDNAFFPASGYGNDYSSGSAQNKETIPCCSQTAAFQFGTIDWISYLNFESYDAKDFIDSNGKVSICYVFTSYKNYNSINEYTLDNQGPLSRNSPYKIYIDRLRAVPASSTEFIPPPDVSEGYSSPLIVLPPWLTDLIPDGTGTTDGTTDGGDGGGGGPSGPGS